MIERSSMRPKAAETEGRRYRVILSTGVAKGKRKMPRSRAISDLVRSSASRRVAGDKADDLGIPRLYSILSLHGVSVRAVGCETRFMWNDGRQSNAGDALWRCKADLPFSELPARGNQGDQAWWEGRSPFPRSTCRHAAMISVS